ncbi:MAG: AbgT family transporter [Sphaerochaetaceae bacterium]|nr:AbgT family transporter [Sphaerochaetaceae bacterium]MDD4007858.1 AbgT family transporter [Sphaerochaetaceae bacterium]MDD4396913.1 AbgT family transporter [Sphaerochaetaceae bacterium]
MDEKAATSLKISKRSFITAIAVLFVLMAATYVLTLVLPGGSYSRTVDAQGNSVIDAENGFEYVEGGIPFWKWLLSPILLLGSSGSGMVLSIIAFLLVIGGIFSSLDSFGLMKYMMNRIVMAFGKARYTFMAMICLFFMLMGAFLGSFEECVPMVPIVVSLAVSFGWDKLTGLGMSLLAVGCGFSSGICNPFTVGVAQDLAGLVMFSGAGMRVLAFVLIYLLLMWFLRSYAKRIERPIDEKVMNGNIEFHRNPKMDKALICFASIIGAGLAAVLSSSFIPAIQDYTMVIVAVMFLAAGLVAVIVAGMNGREIARSFGSGALNILPSVLMILMASSIKYTLEQANVLDTLLHGAVSVSLTLPKWAVILFIYLIVMVMNFFISSGSAKAFLLIPLIVPVAQMCGIPVQLCILAFAFGDGFSNVLYPTNAVLLISLGLTDTSYGSWFKWSWKFFAGVLVITCALLLMGLAIGY